MSINFKALVFDLGGVLYDIDTQKSVNAFRQLDLQNFDDLYSLQQQSHLFDELEKGEISKNEFVQRINTFAGIQLSEDEIVKAWQALLVEMPSANIEILRKLREKFPLYLLSNTNAIHMEAIDEHMKQEHNIQKLSDLFDETFYSFEIGYRKPDKVCYDYVCQKINLPAQSLLFFDDNEDNVKGAREAGWQAIKKEKEQPLQEFLEQEGFASFLK